LVFNGFEIGGSLIYQRQIQEQVFEAIGLSLDGLQQVWVSTEAFEYGTPPHGGIAMV